MARLPAKPLTITEYRQDELLAICRHRGTPQSVALCLKIVLGAAQGLTNKALTPQLSTTLPTVFPWRRQYGEVGLSGILQDQARSGRPKRISQEKEAAIAEATMKTKPTSTIYWSVGELVRAIQEYISENNKRAQPFPWVAQPNTVRQKLNRLKREPAWPVKWLTSSSSLIQTMKFTWSRLPNLPLSG